MLRLLSLLFWIVPVVPTVARSETVLRSPPDSAEIRSIYLNASSGWSTIPNRVLAVFSAVSGHDTYPGRTQHSKIAYHLGNLVVHQRSMLHRAYLYSVLLNEFSEGEILNWYANAVYLGLGCYGVENAAVAYFNKTPRELALQEIAFLAGLAEGPSNYHPIRRHEGALERRNVVLRRIALVGVITRREADEAARTDLGIRNPLGACRPD